MSKIEVYSKDYCPYCVKAKDLLKQKGLKFTEIDVTHDEKGYNIMVNRSNGRKTVPEIFIDGVCIGGCDDLYELEKTGELDELLNKHKEK